MGVGLGSTDFSGKVGDAKRRAESTVPGSRVTGLGLECRGPAEGPFPPRATLKLKRKKQRREKRRKRRGTE